LQRKVKFPTEFDALDLATDDLRAKLLPASRKLKEIEKERDERRKVRKRTKQVSGPASGPSVATSVSVPTVAGDVEMVDAAAVEATSAEGAAVAEVIGKDKDASAGGEEDEFSCRKTEAEEFSKLIDNDVKNDIGASSTGLYELVG
jgi:ubiquitin carboxyl-terminal hydrolase 14